MDNGKNHGILLTSYYKTVVLIPKLQNGELVNEKKWYTKLISSNRFNVYFDDRFHSCCVGQSSYRILR